MQIDTSARGPRNKKKLAFEENSESRFGQKTQNFRK